ncbi:TonB-dependent receptor [Pelagicoccus sp. SDUM812002]|uniref:TonB-dependent receptor plug domain-containing protein n=1 Tax=Pelagicoccus sp. SDUM812002 TaxID=3041266 RepID=UPI00280E0DF7|nr:TonB-dependent receptor [Pelagicoccus sp. SDUM812002]MDQ8187535.1 TonB-dependent receptor [Pelagicoccus sp. SDUM812002]
MNQISEYKTNTASGLLVAGLSFACLAVPARSQENGSDAFFELDAISISANRIEIPVQQVGSTVDVLDAYELQNGQDIFLVDALREIPGLVLRNNGGPGGTFGITTRGLSSNRPTVLLNGIEVSNPSNGQIMNLGNLFTNSASKVEVLRGPQSSLYGADALAGVISVDTLGPGTSNGGRALFGYGSYDTLDYGLGHSGSNGAFSWQVDGLVHESEGFSSQSPEYGEAWADDDAYDNTTLNGAVKYQLNDSVSLHGSAIYIDTFSEFDPGDPAWIWGVPSSENYATTEQLFVRTGSDFQLSEKWDSSVNIAYSDVDTLSQTESGPYYASGKRYKYDWINTVEANERWTMVAGLEYEEEKNLSDVGNRNDTSLFVENVIEYSDALDVTIGARYDDNSAYGEETTYRATFSYRIEDMDARIRGSYGSSFQAPSFYELFNATYGNPSLKAESGKGWDLGIEKTLVNGKLLFSSTAFGNNVKDKIAWDGVYRNLNEYESIGLENAVRYQLSDSLRLKAAYTYSDAEEDNSAEALRVPRSVASIGGNWSGMDGKLGLNLDALFISSQYGDSSSRSAGTKLEGYEVVNVAATYQVSDLSTIWVRFGNVLDSEYEEISGYQTAGANVHAGVRMNF